MATPHDCRVSFERGRVEYWHFACQQVAKPEGALAVQFPAKAPPRAVCQGCLGELEREAHPQTAAARFRGGPGPLTDNAEPAGVSTPAHQEGESLGTTDQLP